MNNKNIKSSKNKPPYTILNNYYYVYSNMWEYDKSLIGYSIVEIIFNVLMPLCAVIAPAVVISLLEREVNVSEFVQTVIVVFLVYSVISAVHSYMERRNFYQYIDIRCNRFLYFLYSKCLHMDYHLYEDEKVRENIERAVDATFSNGQGMEGFMHHNVSLASNILGLIAYAAIISFVSPIILFLLIVISVAQLVVFHRAKMYEYEKKDVISKINVTQSYLQEQSYDLKAAKDIRLYQLNTLIHKVYSKANLQLRRMKTKIMRVYYINDVIGIVLRFLRDAVCYGYLIYLLVHGLEVWYFVLYLGIVSGLADWIMKITENISVISREQLMICDFRNFIDMQDISCHKGGKEIKAEDSALDIVFEHVSYCYNGTEEYVLKDISFHIGKGDRFALVGVNGAGKTTIVKLMCGFYQPTAGRILVNGIDIMELNIDNYFSQIAVVFQDAFTLSFTIGENIYGTANKGINKEGLWKALELSGLKNKIDSLEKGIDTYLNKDMEESGIQLSGGELQKLMLARALYKNAKLLVLDEPTASLDAIAESEMYEKYQTLLQGKTALFISHRLASTRFCNHILFLENGRILEEGTHETLMNLKGKYANMFEVQSQYYKEGEEDELQKGMA